MTYLYIIQKRTVPKLLVALILSLATTTNAYVRRFHTGCLPAYDWYVLLHIEERFMKGGNPIEPT